MILFPCEPHEHQQGQLQGPARGSSANMDWAEKGLRAVLR